MRLTQDQLAAARARGCAVSPATEEQVRRMSMQRRIFHADGLPFVVARDGFFETHATLSALIGKPMPEAPVEAAEAVAATASLPSRFARDDDEASAAPLEAGAASAHGRVTEAPPTKTRKVRAPRTGPPPSSTVVAPADRAAARPPEAEEMLAGIAAAQTSAPGARVVRQRRAGQPPTPRWMVAGKARRGRMK